MNIFWPNWRMNVEMLIKVDKKGIYVACIEASVRDLEKCFWNKFNKLRELVHTFAFITNIKMYFLYWHQIIVIWMSLICWEHLRNLKMKSFLIFVTSKGRQRLDVIITKFLSSSCHLAQSNHNHKISGSVG